MNLLVKNSFMLVCITLLLLSFTPHTNCQNMVYADNIPKEIITHRIKSKELRDFILEYDNKFSQYAPNGASTGIIVSYSTHDGLLEYTVSYMTDIGNKTGVIVCEPINGKEVSIHIPELRNQIALPRERSVELLKNSNPEQYEFHKLMQKEYEAKKKDYKYNRAGGFVEWKIIFDYRGNLLSRDTPESPLSFTPQAGGGNTVHADTIPKEIITHRIVNKKLRNFISKYDEIYNLYAQRTRYNSRGISVSCTIHSDSIVYDVVYVSNIGIGDYGIYGIILCEPINGKEVTMNVHDLHNQITLPRERSVELLKNSNPREYAYYENLKKKYGDLSNHLYYTTNSFPFGIIVFDKHTGKCLRKDVASDGNEGYQKRIRRLLR